MSSGLTDTGFTSRATGSREGLREATTWLYNSLGTALEDVREDDVGDTSVSVNDVNAAERESIFGALEVWNTPGIIPLVGEVRSGAEPE